MNPLDVLQVAATILAGLGGGAVIILGAASWLGKVWANRILEAERHKYSQELEQLRSNLQSSQQLLHSELEKTVQVHRIQFETEYQALLDIWEKLATLRAEMSQLRPTFDLVPKDETDEEREARRRERLRAFCVALNEFVAAVDRRSPFYPKTILQALERVILIARREETELRAFGPDGLPDRSGNKNPGKERFEELKLAIDQVSSAIRDYLEKLRVRE